MPAGTVLPSLTAVKDPAHIVRTIAPGTGLGGSAAGADRTAVRGATVGRGRRRVGGPSGRDRERTRDGIARVALELFAAKGYAGASVRDIAEAMGLTKAGVSYHFPAKDDLLHYLVELVLEAVERVRRLLRASNHPPPERSWLPTWGWCSTTGRWRGWWSTTRPWSTTPRWAPGSPTSTSACATCWWAQMPAPPSTSGPARPRCAAPSRPGLALGGGWRDSMCDRQDGQPRDRMPERRVLRGSFRLRCERLQPCRWFRGRSLLSGCVQDIGLEVASVLIPTGGAHHQRPLGPLSRYQLPGLSSVESASRFTAGCRATKWLVTTVTLERPVPRTMIRHLPKLDLLVNFVTTKWN
jgi:AcrR family transcriptional regulator